MIKHDKKVAKLFVGLLTISMSPYSLAAGVGSDANASSIATTFTPFYSTIPTLLATRTPYGGNLCTLSSATNGFKSAQAKWRSPNIAGTVSLDGYTYEIQRTNISGIGAIARLGAQFDSEYRVPATTVIGSQYRTITATTNAGAKTVEFGHKYWGLVTIPGETLIPGIYSLGQAETMVDVWCQAGNSSNDTHGGGYLSGEVVINSPTCYFGSDVSAITTLNLGQYQWSAVRNLNVGSNFGSVSKTLTMECQAGSWPKLTVSDKNNSNNNSTVISLTNPTASSTAQGIGMQIFLNNQSTAQQLAQQINLIPSRLTNKQTIDLPVEFKYIKTSETVSIGQADAIVDLTFTYD